MAQRLSRSTRLSPGSAPLVEPGSFSAGMVHLGLGAFHRAHQAVYTEAAMARSGGDWGIVGVAPRSHSVLDALREQDFLYSVVTLSQITARARVVGAFTSGLHAGDDRAEVLGLLADPAIKVVTLTVTEKAYRPDAPVMSLLIEGLKARDGAPVTVLSCDNLPSNGRMLARVAGPLPGVKFPSCMVDRIVPATSASTLELAARDLGARDSAAVAAEPFLQWVIEDDFAAGRPDWPAEFTDDVTPWEDLKLRTLNGVHSALAYLGALAGCTYIWEALRLPGMSELLRGYVANEVAASFEPPRGVAVTDYADSVLSRFANAGLGHRTRQVAMDGTQKLPQRLLSVLNTVTVPKAATLIAAAWAEFAAGDRELDDPLADRVRADLATEALFGENGVLPVPDPQRRAMIDAWRREIAKHGAAEVVRSS